jgi:Sulfotransferase family
MIISHGHRFVFAHVPKTGGIAMRAALEPFADGRPDALPGTTHETLPALLARRPDLAGHFKFAFVRNPWERLVSFHAHACHYLSRALPEFEGLSFPAMLRLLDKGAAWLESLHAIRPQSEHARGADFIGRFERIAEDFARVCARLGLSTTLSRRNTSEHGAYASYYDDWGRGFVARRYAEDIAQFGYSFGAMS